MMVGVGNAAAIVLLGLLFVRFFGVGGGEARLFFAEGVDEIGDEIFFLGATF